MRHTSNKTLTTKARMDNIYSTERLSNRARFVRVMLMVVTVMLAVVAYFVSIYINHGQQYHGIAMILNRDFWLTSLFIVVYWLLLDSVLHLNEVYRGRSFSYIFLNIFLENLIGVILLAFTMLLFGLPNFGRETLLLFGGISTALALGSKFAFYELLRSLRRKEFNVKRVVFISDHTGKRLLDLILRKNEWGYKVLSVIGDEYIYNNFKDRVQTMHWIGNAAYETIITQNIDEVIYARDFESSVEMKRLIDICADLGVTFRLYSPFLNRMSSSTQLRYFDMHAVLTIDNTPNNYAQLLFKRIFDICFSSAVILIGLPIWLLIAAAIKIDSSGPIFFVQQRSGLKGKPFGVFKFRTMVKNAEALKAQLQAKNEMTGPVFKMTNDPRITRIGRVLRKTGIDEIPQFLNVFMGDMSIVGPRPPLPSEVAEYERWQLRRLAMKPGITCLWQVARDRNTITFDEWMRMDMNYIDNWTLSLDAVIVLKTILTVLRADGK